jgi:hypothetical protein
MLVASVGKGAVRLVLVPEVARAWAMACPLRVKLTTAKPKPAFENHFRQRMLGEQGASHYPPHDCRENGLNLTGTSSRSIVNDQMT